jgi:hypothetical protein
VLLAASLWPVSITLDDAYESYARTNPFDDPLHPGGYSLILAAIGAASRQVAVTITIQHALGLASAVLLWGAVRRITGSPWIGLLPAAMVAHNPDGIVLEHAIMSESWAMLATAAGLYAAARAFDAPRPWWAVLAGVALGVSVTMRTAGLPVIVVAAAPPSSPTAPRSSRRPARRCCASGCRPRCAPAPSTTSTTGGRRRSPALARSARGTGSSALVAPGDPRAAARLPHLRPAVPARLLGYRAGSRHTG